MSAIKLSAPDWCFYRSHVDPEVHYRRMVEIGIDAAELVDPARAAAARSAGISIISTSGVGMTEGLNKLENHPALIPQIREKITVAGELGIPDLLVFSGNRQDQPDEEGIANVVEGLRQVLPDAGSAGVKLLFEMLNSYEHVDYHADSSRYGFEVARTANSPTLRVVYDIYHMHKMGEDALADIIPNLDIIDHIHIAEDPGRGKPLADGNIDYSAIVRAVMDAGYEGYWGLEFGPREDPYDELREAAVMFRSFVG